MLILCAHLTKLVPEIGSMPVSIHPAAIFLFFIIQSEI